MSSKLFTEWVAYWQTNPFGQEREDLRSAIIACAVVNSMTGAKAKPEDFMIVKPKETPMDAENIVEIFKTFGKLTGGL